MTKSNRFLKVDYPIGEGLKYHRLIHGLSENSWSDEAEAETELYGNERGGKSFDMLKSRAKEQLVNMIFQLDTQKSFKSSIDKAYYSTCKNLLSGAILLNKGRNNAAISQLKLAIKTASEYYFSDLELMSTRLLRNISVNTGKTSKFKQHSSRIRTLIKMVEAEMKAEELNFELISDLYSTIGTDENWINKVEHNYKSLCSIVQEFDTYTTRINMYRVGIRYYDSIYDYKSAIELATECESYLKSNPHLIQKVRLGEMSLQKLYGALHLRDYKNGSLFADDCMKFYNPGTFNWLVFLEYYFLLCLHTNNYSKAKEVYNQVISHKSFDSYPPQNKEKWKIFEAFLTYANPEKEKSIKKFNIPRFINEVPLFSKDKAGYNFSIIIAQIILSIKIGDYESIVAKSEAVKLYASRYIKKEQNPRSYYFIKMIQVMIKYDFDAKKTEQIANKFFVKLKEAHLGEQSELESLEVIPYDLLWPELLQKLEQNNS